MEFLKSLKKYRFIGASLYDRTTENNILSVFVITQKVDDYKCQTTIIFFSKTSIPFSGLRFGLG